MTPIFEMTRNIVNARPSTTADDNAQPLFANDGSAADPASLGFAAVLANWTGQSGAPFADAATQQLNYLLYKAPRTAQGAISHRSNEAQFWSDFVYMVPPFLAYYGAIVQDVDTLREAWNQCRLYRDGLMEFSGENYGLWKHIQQGAREDPGHWTTGLQRSYLEPFRQSEAIYRKRVGSDGDASRLRHDEEF
jgi:rhamnogalacturonyl hydrolase YesR